MKRTSRIIVAVLLVLSLLMAGCTTAKPTETITTEGNENSQKVLRMSIQTEPPNLDPQVGTDSYSIIINNALREGLVRFANNKIEPGMAEKWEISDDQLTYTFHLRDAKWSDGSPVTAKDFEYSLIRLLAPETASQYAYIAYYIKNAQAFNEGTVTDPAEVGVKAVDEKTLKIELAAPTSFFLSLTSFLSYLPSKDGDGEKFGKEYASTPEKMTYNGPYILKEWKHEANLVLEKNPNYWNKDAIKLDRVEMAIVGDDKTAVNMYETGELDMVELGKDFIDTYKTNNQAKFYSNGTVRFLQFNLKGKSAETGKLLSNDNFRKAVSYAIDRKPFTEQILKDGSTPATRYIVSDIMGVEKKFAEEYPLDYVPESADTAKAKEYLDKALEETGMTAANLPTLGYLTDDKDINKLIAEALQDMLSKNLGIKLDVNIVPYKQRLELMKNSDYDIVYAGWGPDYNDPMTYMDIFTTASGYNTTGFNDAEYDKMIEFANTTTDMKARAEKLAEAEKYLLEKGPVVPVFFESKAWACQDYLKNVQTNAVGAQYDFVFADIQK